MQHEIALDGYAYRLRPVALRDAVVIAKLRADPVRSRYLNRSDTTVAGQEAYLREYFERPDDYYFAIEPAVSAPAEPEGFIGIYDVDEPRRVAEWGRWILRPGSLAATESAWLMYRVAFERLNLSEIYSRTLEDNVAVVRFHDRVGAPRVARLPDFVTLDGVGRAAVEHRVAREDWPAIQAKLGTQSRRLADRIVEAR